MSSPANSSQACRKVQSHLEQSQSRDRFLLLAKPPCVCAWSNAGVPPLNQDSVVTILWIMSRISQIPLL